MWSVYSCFQRYKNYKNRPRNARVVVENNVASFFPDTVYIPEVNRARNVKFDATNKNSDPVQNFFPYGWLGGRCPQVPSSNFSKLSEFSETSRVVSSYSGCRLIRLIVYMCARVLFLLIIFSLFMSITSIIEKHLDN